MKPENWMKWDLDSLERTKCKWYLKGFENKDAALGLFLRLVTKLYLTEGHWILEDEMFLETYADESGQQVSDICRALARLKAAKLFIERQDEHGTWFTSKKVLEEVKKREEVSRRRSEAGKKGAVTTNSYRHLPSTSSANSGKERQNAIDKSKSKSNISNVNSPGGEAGSETPPSNEPGKQEDPPTPEPETEKPKTLKLSELVWPQSLDNDQCKAALKEWLSHKKDRRESYKNAKSVNKLLAHWGKFSGAQFLEAVDVSIRNNWAGLHDPQPQRKGAVSSNGYGAAFEANMRERERLLKLEQEGRLDEEGLL